MGFETYKNESRYKSSKQVKSSIIPKLGHAALFSENDVL